ncbi:MAG: hypothetical protein NC453_13880 [Muribaculum sp.]|nr:hypothetical protein [Muribaculum sp.]
MNRNIDKIAEERAELNSLYNAPANKRLKYSAFVAIAITIALLFSMIIWMDNLSPSAILVMRGCAGLGAIIFVALVGILTYRVNKQHIQNRNKQ